ncbi:hypothetical protein AVM02_01685 [Brucella anthropi]|uniref:hypothetical protein n=1 Tax=Brucella anthropi TaxID=529 RepID=UPI003985D003
MGGSDSYLIIYAYCGAGETTQFPPHSPYMHMYSPFFVEMFFGKQIFKEVLTSQPPKQLNCGDFPTWTDDCDFTMTDWRKSRAIDKL